MAVSQKDPSRAADKLTGVLTAPRSQTGTNGSTESETGLTRESAAHSSARHCPFIWVSQKARSDIEALNSPLKSLKLLDLVSGEF